MSGGAAFYRTDPSGEQMLSADAVAILFDRPVEEVKNLVAANPAGVIGGTAYASRMDIPQEWLQTARRRFREGAAATGSADFASIIDHLRRAAS